MLQRALTLAQREWGIRLPFGNPVASVSRPFGGKPRERRLSEDELALLPEPLSAADTLKNIVLFAIETGMRRSEITAMRWDDVDLRKRTLIIHRTKNGEARTIQLSTLAVELLSSVPKRPDGLLWGLGPRISPTSSIRFVADRRAGSANWPDLQGKLRSLRPRPDLAYRQVGLGAVATDGSQFLGPIQVPIKADDDSLAPAIRLGAIP